MTCTYIFSLIFLAKIKFKLGLCVPTIFCLCEHGVLHFTARAGTAATSNV